MPDAQAVVRLNDEDYVGVIDADADLAAAVPADQLEMARRRLVARTLTTDTGAWEPPERGEEESWLGLLVLEGLLTRNVDIAATRSRELLGAGDVVRPWDDDSPLSPIPTDVSWTILEPTRFALLDRRFTMLLGRWPELENEVVHRVLRRSRWLAVRLAIGNLRGVPEQIMLLLWHLASNWGRVGTEGTLVPLELTHETIAELIGARRPSVTTAVTELRERGELGRTGEGWLLRSDPPTA